MSVDGRRVRADTLGERGNECYGNSTDTSPVEIGRNVKIEGRTKDSVGERDRGQLARLERGVGSMRLKFVQQVP